MQAIRSHCIILLVLLGDHLPDLVVCSPKKYSNNDNGDSLTIGNLDSGFQPSNVRYYETDLSPPLANVDGTNKKPIKQAKPEKERQQQEALDDNVKTESNRRVEQRFGGLPYGTGAYDNGAHGTGVTYSNPIKIDIGGVALGALLGLGLVLFVPKLAHVFGHGNDYRSLDGDNAVTAASSPSSMLSDWMSDVDRSLKRFDIDGAGCVQRIVCDYVSGTAKRSTSGKTNAIESTLMDSITNNVLLGYLIDGTAVKDAIDVAMATRNDAVNGCDRFYSRCPVNGENVGRIAAALLVPNDKESKTVPANRTTDAVQ